MSVSIQTWQLAVGMVGAILVGATVVSKFAEGPQNLSVMGRKDALAKGLFGLGAALLIAVSFYDPAAETVTANSGFNAVITVLLLATVFARTSGYLDNDTIMAVIVATLAAMKFAIGGYLGADNGADAGEIILMMVSIALVGFGTLLVTGKTVDGFWSSMGGVGVTAGAIGLVIAQSSA